MRRITLLCFFLASLAWAVTAAEPSSRNPIPDPQLLMESDSYSVAVVSMRADAEPVKTLLSTAWTSLATGESKLPGNYNEVNDFISQNKDPDLVLKALPFQAVRVDRMANGKTSPTYAVTLSGWRGLQSIVYNTLCKGPDGKAFPAEFYRRTDLVNRNANDATGSGILAKVNGTFLYTPTSDLAKKVIDRLMPADKPVPPSAGTLLEAYKGLDQKADAFGTLINQKDSFSALLKEANIDQVQKFRDKVGNDRLEKAVAKTKTVVWSGRVVSADRAELSAVFNMPQPNVAEVAKLLEEGKTSLDQTKVVDIVITPGQGNVTLKLAVIGLKQMLIDALASSKK